MKRPQLMFITRLFLLLALMIVIVGCSSKSNEEATTNVNENDNENENENENDKVPTEEGKPQQGGELVIAYETDVSNYDPIKGSAGTDHTLLWPVYDTLVTFTTELEPEPGLAESWELPDDKTMVFTLKEGVTFHDGTPFNAEAVKYNLERVNSEDSKVSDLPNVESVEVVDERTVKLNLSQPDSSILLALSDRAGMMVSPTAVKESGEDFSQNPVGAGPYKMVTHVPNGEIVLEAYEDYWQEGQPYLDKMTIKIMSDENARINSLKSGEIDFADNITPGNLETLKKESTIKVKGRTGVGSRFIYLNTSKPPLDNKAVRLAIQHGINREALNQVLDFGTGEPANQLFPMDYWAADKNMKIDYDPEKSKELLKEAGLENISFDMNIYTPAYQQRLAEAIRGQLSEIGIEVKLNTMELQAATANYFTEKEAAANLAGWTGRPDAQMTINNLFSAEGFYNVGGHSTPEIEALIAEAAASYDQDERAKLYGEISQKALLEEATAIPLYFYNRASAMKLSVKGYEPNMLGKSLYSTIWLEQ